MKALLYIIFLPIILPIQIILWIFKIIGILAFGKDMFDLD